jgi:hypothetical protein
MKFGTILHGIWKSNLFQQLQFCVPMNFRQLTEVTVIWETLMTYVS